MKPIYHIQLNEKCVYQVYLEKPAQPFSQAKQVHGVEIIPYQDGINEDLKEADGIFLLKKNMEKNISYSLAIKTADCLPVVLIGPHGYVHLHAGWKGLANHILQNHLIKEIAPTMALIGPSIRVEQYQVGEAFLPNFKSDRAFQEMNHSLHFNLQKEATLQLQECYPHIQVVDSGWCTFNHPLLHSFRREKGELRNWNILTVSL